MKKQITLRLSEEDAKSIIEALGVFCGILDDSAEAREHFGSTAPQLEDIALRVHTELMK